MNWFRYKVAIVIYSVAVLLLLPSAMVGFLACIIDPERLPVERNGEE